MYSDAESGGEGSVECWLSDLDILAQRFFDQDFDMGWLLSEEEAFLQRLVARVQDMYLISSTSGNHYLQIRETGWIRTKAIGHFPYRIIAVPVEQIEKRTSRQMPRKYGRIVDRAIFMRGICGN